MIRFAAILFDFDGVLIESEAASNRQIAAFLTAAGHPTTAEESMARFMGLASHDFHAAIEAYVGGPMPGGFVEARRAADRVLMKSGIAAVAGAVAFVQALPAGLPIAVVSSSATKWLHAHLAHLGLAGRFGAHVYSGREHVTRGKPAPDLYLHAAAALGVAIADCAIIEDSPVGVTGAVASGAHVVGLCAGSHCAAGHAARLRALGVHDVAASFGDVADIVGLGSDDVDRFPGRTAA